MPADIEQEVRQFLKRNFPLGDDAFMLKGDASLLDAGFIDSTGVLEIVQFVESWFSIDVPENDLLPENFDSVGNIVQYVTRRLEGPGAQ